MKKRVLLQCQALTYLYMGLGAIYTKYKDCADNLEIDVLFTSDFEPDNFIEKIRLSQYVHNVYCINRASEIRKISKRINKLKDNIWGKFMFNTFYRPQAHKVIKSKIPDLNYDDVFFSHEQQLLLISLLKDIDNKINFVVYGDGSGLLMKKDFRLVNPFQKLIENPVLQEIIPNEIIALAPIVEDGSCEFDNIPVMATDPNILSNLIENDINIQGKIANYIDSILEKYSHIENKILLLADALNDTRYETREEDQVNIYLDMIDKYCPENSLVILKLHPSSNFDISKILEQQNAKNCIFEVVPHELKEYPIEIYCKLIKKLSLAITFLSSSRISLSILYNVDTTDAFDIIQKYPLKNRMNLFLNSYAQTIKLYSDWDRKSILYKCDLVPSLIKCCKK